MRITVNKTVKGMVRNTVKGTVRITIIKWYNYGYGENYM